MWKDIWDIDHYGGILGFSSIGSERAPPCINAFTVILSILLRCRLVRSPANSLTAFAQTVPPTCQLCSQNGQNCLPNAFIHGRAISTVLDMSHKKCRTYVQSPSYMKTAYWFAPTFFIVNNVESRRCTLQNKHLFENPWVGAHSVRTENHCLSTQSVRVWFAVLTIGGASPRTKDFLPNAHL